MKKLFLIFYLFIFFIPVYAQKIINTEVTGTVIVQDLISITLKDGFTVKAGNDFTARINQNLPPSITYISPISTINPTQNYSPLSQENYIRTIVPRVEWTESIPASFNTSDANDDIQYFDGLGRPLQNVSLNASPDMKDIYRIFEYDEIGREAKKYLPVETTDPSLTANKHGSLIDPTALKTTQSYFYNNLFAGEGNYAYAESKFDGSPLNRIIKQGNAGTAWNVNGTHVTNLSYSSNSLSDHVKLLRVDDNGNIYISGEYEMNQLFKNTVNDENGNLTEEFKNIEEKVILKRTYSGSSIFSTYYVYDDFGLLRYVIPPAADDFFSSGVIYNQTSDVIKKYCFYYKYDARHRMILKQLPGADYVEMKYDNLDRLILTQDGNQRVKKQWSYIKYETLNRPSETGLWDQGSSDPNGFNNSTITECTWYTQTYYDNYNMISSLSYNFDASNGLLDIAEKSDNVKGKVTITLQRTMNYVNIANGALTVKSVFYYDKFGRVIQIVSSNHIKGFEYITNKYLNSVTSELIKTRHKFNSSITLDKDFVYDHRGRLKETGITINNGSRVVVSSLDYNPLGQIKTKRLHSVNKGSGIQGDFLQKVDYTYNIRGWLQNINNGASLNSNENDLFGMELFYDKLIAGHSDVGTEQYNGNISAMKWKTAKDETERMYAYNYDGLNRLIKANYGEPNKMGTTDASYDLPAILYDKNGNITTMQRFSQSNALIDYLYYNYKGNQVTYIRDASGNDEGYKKNSTTTNYSYDANGNMIQDKLKLIDKITYNYLNLPDTIFFTTGQRVKYIYSATGQKLRKIVINNNAIDYTASLDYCGNFVYNLNSQLQYILMDEGRILPSPTGEGLGVRSVFEYNLKDHLGNTRVTFNEYAEGIPQVLQTEHYDPWGYTLKGIGYNAYSNTGLSENKYKYNGKEYQDETGWFDYGARMYDAVIGRWMCIDPSLEKSYWSSPYNYCFNDPLKFFDPNGKWPKDIHSIIIMEAAKKIAQDYGIILTNDQLYWLIKGSQDADKMNNQSIDRSFIHYMRDPNVSKEQVVNDVNKWISDNINEYATGNEDQAAYMALGRAAHPMMDITSPTHTTQNADGSIEPRTNDLPALDIKTALKVSYIPFYILVSCYKLVNHRLGERESKIEQLMNKTVYNVVNVLKDGFNAKVNNGGIPDLSIKLKEVEINSNNSFENDD